MPAVRLVPLLALAAALAAATPREARAADAAAPSDAQIDAVFAPWSGDATPGCALGIARNGEPDRIRGYGMANLEHGARIGPETVFHTASISKQFTAFAIALLAQDGKLSLDDDVRRYLPQLPDYGKPITLAQLMHHTNGLREQGQLLNLSGWRGDDLYTQDDMLQALSRQTRANFDPGEEVLYGNAAYTVLAQVVRSASGQPLPRFAEERIFRPLGMRDTRIQEDHNEIVPHRAQAYAARDGGWRGSVPNYDHYGSTSLLTTAGDLLKWQRNLLDARVGGEAAMRVLRTSGRLNDGTVTGYGGGLRIGDYRGLPILAHDGADAGFRSDAVLFPKHGLAVVALCNGASIAPTELTRRVAELYLGARMTRPAYAPAVRLRRTDPAALAGNYWSELTDEVVRLEFKDGALRQVGTPAAFVPIGEGAFRPGESEHVWRFDAPRAGAAAELSIRDFWPTQRRFVRILDPLPAPAALAAFAGRYFSAETATTYEVRIGDDGRLRLQWARGYDLALDAVGGDRFLGSRGTVSFGRGADGAVDALTISNRRLRRLRAERIAPAPAVAAAPASR